jgi:hypothetical protein
MIAVQTETLVGLIGFGGAVMGAGGALLGGWLQHRQQADTARRERWEGYGRSAGEATLTELLTAQEEMTDWARRFSGSEDDAEELHTIILKRGSAAKHSSLLIPEASELRARLKVVLDVMMDYYSAPAQEGFFQSMARLRWSYMAAQEGIELLAAFLRGEHLPTPTAGFTTQRSQRDAYRAEHPLAGS